MVSLALCSEMEPNPCCEENKESAEEPKAMEVLSGLADEDSSAELPREPAEEPGGRGEGETETCGGPSEDNEVKSPSDPSEQDSGETELNDQRRLRKPNSWKTVRFRDPSEAQPVLLRDKSLESLFQDYAMEEWTSTFEELFMAEDWEDVTGRPEDTSVYNASHLESYIR